MNAVNTTCVLCGQPAKAKETDRGIRRYIVCSNATCGDFEITNRAARELGDNVERKNVLREMVSRANDKGQILDISIASDGAMQTTGIKRG
jgi:ssDNA-binding Zn-finger/Zn-ribbon topoisomerase 1